MSKVRAIKLKTEIDTLALGARLASVLQAGDIVLLSGGLGAGKTTLARGLIQSRLGEIDVPSPTYTLVQAYDWGDVELWHCDLYRLDRPDDAYELGLMDAMGEEIVLIEWADKLGALCPGNALRIDLSFDGDSRIATLSGWEERNV
ncbi:tRNA (adenosine(37)-N6)-threonylcarbamoyltransferase complex ATPase subunit type 1 TsaE [Algimonas arctica]|uniref:tRNA threonylcarbamoyladenosine biosynthesis protein TsaE n=1 Tax=Algimonas arctica TaxID=1479486 RepID=A0A8J3CUP2_9PROT|nr:tRNA (adenosine(37)-N6)-threonylcarbamoyltransferase complex ATPase subunit type 1 TsaE [Algimonas arctica]GHB02553.1 tRNA (adenosine(37)-N6)-threonylcarbamoyltransferase complex ATPase subunit type 1 TsaE [Algimonas arctica]